MDNTPYFLDKIHELYVEGDDKDENSSTICRKDMRYMPSWEDYVRIRDQTTGVLTYNVKTTAQNQEWNFRLTDVGGQRSERRKWVNLFHDIGVVMFVTSLNAYDQTVYEATGVKCYDESFDVFRQLVQNQAFQSTDFVVFLNKLDLFEEKLKQVPFTVYEESFDDSSKHHKDKVIEYVENKFESIWRKDCPEQLFSKRGLFFHLTCSLDTPMMQSVMEDVNLALVNRAMYSSCAV